MASKHARVHRRIERRRIESARAHRRTGRMLRVWDWPEEMAQDALGGRRWNSAATDCRDNPGAWLMATAKRERSIDCVGWTLIERKHDELAHEFDDLQQSRGPLRSMRRPRYGYRRRTCCA